MEVILQADRENEERRRMLFEKCQCCANLLDFGVPLCIIPTAVLLFITLFAVRWDGNTNISIGGMMSPLYAATGMFGLAMLLCVSVGPLNSERAVCIFQSNICSCGLSDFVGSAILATSTQMES